MRITCTLISFFYHLYFQMGFTLANGRHVMTALCWSVLMGEARGPSESSVLCLGLSRGQRRSQWRAVPPLTLLRPRAWLLPASSVTVYDAVCFSVFPHWGQQTPSEITPSCMGRNNHWLIPWGKVSENRWALNTLRSVMLVEWVNDHKSLKTRQAKI